MKTVTGAARKLTGASMAAFLATDPDDADGVLVVRGGVGPGAAIVARRRGRRPMHRCSAARS